MRNFGFIFLAFVVLESSGTTGNIQFYNFSTPKHEVEKDLRYIINKNTDHSVPVKWADINKDTGPIEYIYIYFKLSEEMYQVGFTGDSNEWKNSANCQLGLVGLFNGDHWEYRKV